MNTTYSSKRSALDLWLAVAAIVAGLVWLGLTFAWATDPRPVQGTLACAKHLQGPMTDWNRDRDGPLGCKGRFWSTP